MHHFTQLSACIMRATSLESSLTLRIDFARGKAHRCSGSSARNLLRPAARTAPKIRGGSSRRGPRRARSHSARPHNEVSNWILGLVAVALIAGVLAPAIAAPRAAAQQQTSWYVNDNPSLFGPSRYWWTGDAGRGYGSNNYRFTYAAGGESNAENWARWSMGRRVGRQEIQVYVPQTKAAATVVYRIDVGGTVYTRRMAQRDASGWTSLGNYDTDGSRVTIVLRDNDASQHWNRDGYSASTIGVDAARMRCVSRCSSTPPPTTTTTTVAPSGSSGSSCAVVSLGTVGGSVSRSGNWSRGCGSSRRGGGYYARQYRFVVGAESDVRIDVESSTVDTYLYLLDSRGRVVEQDDDGGSGRNSRIARRLGAGTYTVEATTYSPGETGSFTLRVRAGASPPPPTTTTVAPSGSSGSSCAVVSLGTVGGSVSRSGNWSRGCGSSRRGGGYYARQYRFVVGAESDVRIDVESSTVDTYLYLLDSRGRVVEQDDDGGSGRNSRIARRLGAGTYTVEATTYSPGETGSFTLRVRAGASPPPPTTTTVAPEQRSEEVVFRPQEVAVPPKTRTVAQTADPSDSSKFTFSAGWARRERCLVFGIGCTHYYIGSSTDISATWYMGDLQGRYEFFWKTPKDQVNHLTGRPIWRVYERRYGSSEWRLVKTYRPGPLKDQRADKWVGYYRPRHTPIELDGEVKIVITKDPNHSGPLGIREIKLRHADLLPEHRQAAIAMCRANVRRRLTGIGGATLSLAAAVLIVAAAPSGAAAVSTAVSTKGLSLLHAAGVFASSTVGQFIVENAYDLVGLVTDVTSWIVDTFGNIFESAVDSYQQGCSHFRASGVENFLNIVKGYGVYGDEVAEVAGRRT